MKFLLNFHTDCKYKLLIIFLLYLYLFIYFHSIFEKQSNMKISSVVMLLANFQQRYNPSKCEAYDGMNFQSISSRSRQSHKVINFIQRIRNRF